MPLLDPPTLNPNNRTTTTMPYVKEYCFVKKKHPEPFFYRQGPRAFVQARKKEARAAIITYFGFS